MATMDARRERLDLARPRVAVRIPVLRALAEALRRRELRHEARELAGLSRSFARLGFPDHAAEAMARSRELRRLAGDPEDEPDLQCHVPLA